MRKIVTGDEVCVVSGADSGKVGKVLSVVSHGSTNSLKIIVSGVNVRKYIKKLQSGKKMESKEFPIDISNVMMIDSKSKLRSRIGFKFIDDMKKRYFKKSGEILN